MMDEAFPGLDIELVKKLLARLRVLLNIPDDCSDGDLLLMVLVQMDALAVEKSRDGGGAGETLDS